MTTSVFDDAPKLKRVWYAIDLPGDKYWVEGLVVGRLDTNGKAYVLLQHIGKQSGYDGYYASDYHQVLSIDDHIWRLDDPTAEKD